MKKYVIIISILLCELSYSESLPTAVTFTTEQIIQEKVDKVNQQNQMGPGPVATKNIFKSGEDSQGTNLASVVKSQKVGLDLNTEAEQLRSDVIADQKKAGTANPQGCADTSTLSEYQNNLCLAAFTLQSMGIEAVGTQSEFKDVANKSYETMEDVSAFPLDNSASSYFSSDKNGLPTSTNILYSTNKPAIDSFHQLFKSLEETSGYKGLKFSTKNNYFYLDGKKYSTSVLISREAMIKAGIKKSLADFAFAVLAKKSKLAQDGIKSLLKDKKLYDGKNWSILKYQKSADDDSVAQNPSGQETQVNSAFQEERGENTSRVDLSSSLVEEKTLYKEVDGIPLGLSSDDIFKIISRKYREKIEWAFSTTLLKNNVS